MTLQRIKRMFPYQYHAKIERVRFTKTRSKGKYHYSTISITGDLVERIGWGRGTLVMMYVDREKRKLRIVNEEGRDAFTLGAGGKTSNCLRFYFKGEEYLPEFRTNMLWTADEIKVGDKYLEVSY